MSAWPSSICTTRRSAPWLSRCVANAWRSVCGDSFLPGIARCAVALDQLPERLPRHAGAARGHEERLGGAALRIAPAPRAGSATSHAAASSPSGTRRSLQPLPMTRTHAGCRGSPRPSSAAPAPRRAGRSRRGVSSMARSRRPSGARDVRRGQQRLDVGLGERLRKARRALRRLELERRVGGDAVLAHEELVEALEARGEPRLRARARAMPRAMTVGEVAEHVGLARRGERAALPREPGCRTGGDRGGTTRACSSPARPRARGGRRTRRGARRRAPRSDPPRAKSALGVRPWGGPAGLLDYPRAKHALGVRPWGGPAGRLDYPRAKHALGVRPWGGPAGRLDYPSRETRARGSPLGRPGGLTRGAVSPRGRAATA